MGRVGRKREKARSRKSTKKTGKKELSVAATINVTQHVLSSVAESSEMAIIHRSNPNPRKIGLYSNRQRILLVGEGDFSFAAALATALGGERIVATSLDSLSKLLEKYGASASTALSTLRRLGAQIAHRVDALDLGKSLPSTLVEGGFDRVSFNFPHVGGATAEDVAANQKIVREFARSACGLLRPGPNVANSRQTPQVHVTLRATPFYQSWDVGRVAEESGEVRLVKTVPFDTHAFQTLGYSEVRTNPAARDAPSTIAAETYVWEPTRDSASVVASSRSKAVRKTPPSKQVHDDDGGTNTSAGTTTSAQAAASVAKRTKPATPDNKSANNINSKNKKVILQRNTSGMDPLDQHASLLKNKEDDSSNSGISHRKMSTLVKQARAHMKTKTKINIAMANQSDDDESYKNDAREMMMQSDSLDIVSRKRALEKKLRQIDSLKASPRSALNEGQKTKLLRESALRAELAAL